MDRIEKLCAERGMRMTEQRRVIARVLSNAEDHPDVEELYRRASAIDPHISIATVYRTVRLFEEAGVVEKHDFGDGRSRYEEAGDDHHDHLIDTRTGEVIEFFDAEIERLKTEIAKRLGFDLVGHKLELYGKAIPGAAPEDREGLVYKRHAARVAPGAVDA
ncbi:MAG: transcriptional repressor [Alphaproteobacteria bacterium]|nr:transcriptional repressor [Alphaproteobacteria bacterium]MBU1527221.1 transcriptional repressor [Alphaproteobacteria bacterium]MBU2351165.1 transcriptional repressor [Alphaproteobacteria bacterium]MBU2382336.1 transcriptional repressor [Alphaproteobacteria bacterium]